MALSEGRGKFCARSPPRDVELQILQKEPPRSYSLTFTNGRLVGAIPNARDAMRGLSGDAPASVPSGCRVF